MLWKKKNTKKKKKHKKKQQQQKKQQQKNKTKQKKTFFFIKLAQSFFEFCFCGNIWLSIDKFIQIGMLMIVKFRLFVRHDKLLNVKQIFFWRTVIICELWHFLAHMYEVHEELLYYPQHQRRCCRRWTNVSTKCLKFYGKVSFYMMTSAFRRATLSSDRFC